MHEALPGFEGLQTPVVIAGYRVAVLQRGSLVPPVIPTYGLSVVVCVVLRVVKPLGVSLSDVQAISW